MISKESKEFPFKETKFTRNFTDFRFFLTEFSFFYQERKKKKNVLGRNRALLSEHCLSYGESWGSCEPLGKQRTKKTEDEKEQNKKTKKNEEKKHGVKKEKHPQDSISTHRPHIYPFSHLDNQSWSLGIHTECSEPQATNVAKPDR